MNEYNLPSRIEGLIQKVIKLGAEAQGEEFQNAAVYTVECLDALLLAQQNNTPVFGVEPWHRMMAFGNDVSSPGEYLLRLKDRDGEMMPPYPAIMMFYENGLEAEIDTILFLCALAQFYQDDEKRVSVNISARSFLCVNFVTSVLEALEGVGLGQHAEEKIIFEIHESAPNMVMSQSVLESFKRFGAAFAIDDVGLSMGDVFRLSEFERMADYIKIDRSCVCAANDASNSLGNAISLVRALLPDSIIVAEGVRSTEHALQLHEGFPDISYVQGLYLPSREDFVKEWQEKLSFDKEKAP